MTKLDIALIKVSIVLIVKESPKTTITKDKISDWSLSNKEKKLRSGTTLGSIEMATKPLKPINNTIGTIAINEAIKLFLRISLFFAAYTLCQFPWWKRFVAATAIKKVNPAV